MKWHDILLLLCEGINDSSDIFAKDITLAAQGTNGAHIVEHICQAASPLSLPVSYIANSSAKLSFEELGDRNISVSEWLAREFGRIIWITCGRYPSF